MNNPCIYKIKNIITNDEYVGSTSKGIKHRKRTHLNLLKNKCHHNRHLQYAWNKWGKRNFQFEILEIVNDINILVQKEQEWILKLSPVYNVMRDVKSHIGIKRSKETCERISNALKGRTMTELHKKNIRETLIGKKQSLKTIQKRIESQHKPICQYDLNNKMITEWKSATFAAEILNLNRKSIYRCLWGDRKSYHKFVWKYKDI